MGKACGEPIRGLSAAAFRPITAANSVKDRTFANNCPLLRWLPLVKTIPSYLKLVSGSENWPATADEDLAALAELCLVFEQLTGRSLEYSCGPVPRRSHNLLWSAPVDPGVGTSPGHHRFFLNAAKADRKERVLTDAQAKDLAHAIATLWGELYATRQALRNREAELAAGVPLVSRPDEPQHLSTRLEAVLRGGAEAIGCQAAALYMLDAATTELKLRSSWGLPQRRLLEPARPLRGAVADLEAMLGHAVVLSDRTMFEVWNAPQDFASAVCVPVSSPSIPLGTLWVFSGEPRDFSDAQTNLVEMIAGRLAADLEREMLLTQQKTQRSQASLAVGCQRLAYQSQPPLIEGWDVAGKSCQIGQLGPALHDWFGSSDGAATVIAGIASRTGVDGALIATAVRTAARACAPQVGSSAELLDSINHLLWTGSNGDFSAGLCCARVAPGFPNVIFAAAGPVRAIAVTVDGYRQLAQPSPALGSHEHLRAGEWAIAMKPGDLLILYAIAGESSIAAGQIAEVDDVVSRLAAEHRRLCSGRLVELLHQALSEPPSKFAESDRTLVVMKRRG